MEEDGEEASEEESIGQASAEGLCDFLQQSGHAMPGAESASEEALYAAAKRLRLAKPKRKAVKRPRKQ